MARMQLGSNVVVPAIIVGGNEVAGYTIGDNGVAYSIAGEVVIKGVVVAEYRSFFYRFAGCRDMTRISFPDLERIGGQGLQRVCSECANLSVVDFPKLQTLASAALTGAFNTCSSLQEISFPALRNVADGAFGTSSLCFAKCTALTSIHFPAAIRSTIQSTTGYASNFGAVNATIYFDL